MASPTKVARLLVRRSEIINVHRTIETPVRRVSDSIIPSMCGHCFSLVTSVEAWIKRDTNGDKACYANTQPPGLESPEPAGSRSIRMGGRRRAESLQRLAR